MYSGPPARPMPMRLGRYHVRAKIGEGGMATVYLGHQTHGSGVERVVALKVIKDEFSLNRDFVNMFLDEAKIVSRLSHPNVVRVYELGSEGTRLFIAMELLFGQSLWHVWNACRLRGVRLKYEVAAWIAARCAQGLDHAHDLRSPDGTSSYLVHRDINASNIFVTYDGQVKIIDFGLAKAIGRVSKTAAGIVKGKLAYMSPEQAVGKPLDRRSDVFALGTTLWEITTDRRLFKGSDDLDTLKRVYAADVPDACAMVEGFPAALRDILRRALAREAKDRYATAADFGRDLDKYACRDGSPMGPPVVAEVMQALFRSERERQAHWISEASASDKPAPNDALVSPEVPKFGMTMPPPGDSKAAALDTALFSGPAITLRDPVLAARQAATAQGGVSTGEMARIKRTVEAPFRAAGDEEASIAVASGRGRGMTAVLGVVALLVVSTAVAALVWMLKR